MAAYGADMKFGVHTGLQNTTTDELRALWRKIDAQGFEWISIWDHFYAADATVTAEGTSSGSVCLEAIASHAALAVETERVRCGSLVYCVAYRHPAVLANAAATLDHLSGGRITMGLGGGWHQGEFAAYGMEFEPVPVRLRRTDEAIQVIRKLLTEETADFKGEFYELHEARCDPKPVQQRLPLWIGGSGEKVTLRIAAQHADGWNVPFIPPEGYRGKVEVLEKHCERLGRDPATIEKSVNLTLAWSDEDLRERFGGMADWIKPSALTGSTQQIIDRVGEYRDAGADWAILAMRAPFDQDGLDRFADEVLPALS
jgi:F420-dependent oxidoreductase-like protein